ncbi:MULTISPECIES: LysR family transcriptional regulator [Methylobacterium]|uniref:LysR family transcriptional regulator n=1 Tax=Methylobacterium TaxID=407 RepID=UPI0013EE2C70|nr:LysR family transcriptional regulator [Methylobacterium sp. DB0501]NGM34193.1 LysR family transcriptional regulator [Methylobacterium sp. DB0501]
MSISLKQIRYFIAAAESGRISQAAVELNVSQSAVTAAVQQLEGTLGVRLFERHAAGVALTREGNRFLLHGRNIMAAVAEAVREPRAAGAAVTGTVRVGVTYTVAGYFLPRHHARFASSFPGVTLTLFEAPRDVIERALIDGALDIAVMLVSNLQARDALASETLIRSRRRLWLPAEHPLLRQGRVGLSDVARHPYIMLTVDEAGHTSGRYWALTPFRPEVIFKTSSVESVRSMVAAGMGVTILSDLVYRPWSLEGQRLERRQVEDDIPTMDVGLAWRADTDLSPAARTFREFVNLACAGQG